MKIAKEVEELLNEAASAASQMGHEYVTPEHVWYVISGRDGFKTAFENCGGNPDHFRRMLREYLSQLEKKEHGDSRIEISYGLNRVMEEAAKQAFSSEADTIELPHLLSCMMELEESNGAYYVGLLGVTGGDLLAELGWVFGPEAMGDHDGRESVLSRFAVCINEAVEAWGPFIGREEELLRTMQVLCRFKKNNPLHIGEPGVGKTAITYGLAARINAGLVPARLKNARIYGIDLGSMLAGTQFRGEFEKRLKAIMEELTEEENPILYIDEIHNLVGAGAVNGGSMDASNLLKPYLADGRLRFIGATTFEEYKKYFSKDKSLVRRFQNIDIREPGTEETVEILSGLKTYYEEFHHVRYQKGTMEHAAELSSRYMNERFLPDKAIDLIDEAGAYLELHPTGKKRQTVDKKLIEEVLAAMAGIPKQTVETGEIKKLAQLEKELKNRVFGQDEAVIQLANAVRLSRAGLSDEDKPVASLLFVGPTGVGKTELAKAVSSALGIRLIRFDMSEYAEKHTVAKLIGSPAGYVGYEEGGLLTEAVRKQPRCVLLLDEIEKAHPDIYNVLLQVMDYATLTDNQGRKADFRNVLLIMTSNAGAHRADRSAIGFGGRELDENAIYDEVKRVFRPEFRNRLDRIVLFRPLNSSMADRIVKKQFGLLAEKAAGRQIRLILGSSGLNYLKARGLNREYGAREIVRLINQEVKPLLVDEMLSGRLKKGGECRVVSQGGKIVLERV